MFNSIGTIIRALILMLSLTMMWFTTTTLIYFIVISVLNIPFSLSSALLAFAAVMLFRMFYPKNVFI